MSPPVPKAQRLEVLDEPATSRPASAILVDGLRQGIMRGVLKDGERLRHDAVATRFGVSQMIVRKAFRQLVTEGFSELSPGGAQRDRSDARAGRRAEQ